MFGRLEWGKSRKCGEIRDLYGMPVLTVETDPDGFGGDRRLRRAGQLLRKGGVIRVLPPRDGLRWELLRPLGLRPLDPAPLLRAQAPRLALAGLERQGLDPRRAVLSLSALRPDGELLRTARALCPRVRRLVVDAPEGERLARQLREEFGLPILPPDRPADLCLRFHPGLPAGESPVMELWGERPELAGLHLTAPELGEEDREDLPLLCALWQWGRLGEEGIKFA